MTLDLNDYYNSLGFSTGKYLFYILQGKYGSQKYTLKQYILAKRSGLFCENIFGIYCKINLFRKHLHFVFNHILLQCVFLQNIFTLQYLHFVLNHILPQCIFLQNIYLPCNIYIFAQNEVVHFARIYYFSGYFCRTYFTL